MQNMSSDQAFLDEVQRATSEGIVELAARILAGVPVSLLDELVEAAIEHAQTMPVAFDMAQDRARQLHARPRMVVPDMVLADAPRPALRLVDGIPDDDEWGVPFGHERAA